MAELESERIILASELNELRDEINRMRLSDGRPELTEEEMPIACEDEHSYFYADHVMRKIFKAYNNGEILESGTSSWY